MQRGIKRVVEIGFFLLKSYLIFTAISGFTIAEQVHEHFFIDRFVLFVGPAPSLQDQVWLHIGEART